jgi:hypothetical protein
LEEECQGPDDQTQIPELGERDLVNIHENANDEGNMTENDPPCVGVSIALVSALAIFPPLCRLKDTNRGLGIGVVTFHNHDPPHSPTQRTESSISSNLGGSLDMAQMERCSVQSVEGLGGLGGLSSVLESEKEGQIHFSVTPVDTPEIQAYSLDERYLCTTPLIWMLS